MDPDVVMDPLISETSFGVKRPSLSSEMASSSTKRARIELPLEQLMSINNEMEFFTNLKVQVAANDHQEMKKLSSTILVHLITYLSTTNAKANTLKGLGLKEAEAVIDSFNEDELREWGIGLQKGFQDNDWSYLIAHHTAKLHVATTKTKSLPLGVPIQHQNAVIEAWKAEYLGTAALSLMDAIDEINGQPVEHNYAKIIAMIQSSGTGKSKTVDEIAKTRVFFPLCLREEIGENSFAYPPVDEAVRDHLLSAPPVAQELQCKAYLRAFLVSLFTQALNQTNQFIKGQELIGNSKPTYVALATMFYDLFSDASKRGDFYEKVVENATPVDNITILRPSLQSLKSALLRCQCLPLECCLLHIGVDEVHLLFEQRQIDLGSNHTLFSRLKSVISEVVAEPLCLVFLSTAGTVSELPPAQDIAPSMRERDDERILPAPFTELPFDVDIIRKPLVSGKEELSSVGSVGFTAMFGRPMFFAFYKSRKSQGAQDDDIARDMMRIVREKLCGFPWPPNKSAVLDSSCFAVLSARLLLDISPASSQTRKYEEDQVRSHLRFLYSVQQQRHVIVTGSSPEPLIAEAAAEIMHHHIKDGTAYMDIWALLSQFIDNGVIALGPIGELIGRVLSILAMDQAIDSLPRHRQRQLKYQTPITVEEYYKALLTDEAWETLRRSLPANAEKLVECDATTTFEDAFRNAHIHFSHYAKANDDTPMNDRYSWALWLRGTAVLCQLNQNLTDRAIPIYFPNAGGIGPNSMSVILDQDKAGQSVKAALVNIQSAQSLGVFSPGNGLPYIDGVHCYALTEKQQLKVRTRRNSERNLPESNVEAPRYRFEVSGLASYRQITSHHADIIVATIDGTKNSVFTHHPRQRALSLLRMMQPMLNGTSDATAWFGGFKA